MKDERELKSLKKEICIVDQRNFCFNGQCLLEEVFIHSAEVNFGQTYKKKLLGWGCKREKKIMKSYTKYTMPCYH